jgi:hypothetical protein
MAVAALVTDSGANHRYSGVRVAFTGESGFMKYRRVRVVDE